jgi:ribonuclease HI
LYQPNGKTLAYIAVYCGDHVTNNFAEYVGIVLGLLLAKVLGIQDIKGYADSKLCVNQISRTYKCKSTSLQPLLSIVLNLVKKIKKCKITWVRREENKVADGCANEAMDGKGNNDYVRIAQYDDDASVSAQMAREKGEWGEEHEDDDDEWFAKSSQPKSKKRSKTSK